MKVDKQRNLSVHECYHYISTRINKYCTFQDNIEYIVIYINFDKPGCDLTISFNDSQSFQNNIQFTKSKRILLAYAQSDDINLCDNLDFFLKQYDPSNSFLPRKNHKKKIVIAMLPNYRQSRKNTKEYANYCRGQYVKYVP